MLNFGDLFGKLNDVKARLAEVKEQLDSYQVEAEAGGGMVRVTATAARRVVKIAIDPAIIDKDDPELLGDLVAAAVNKAIERADERAKTELDQATKGMLPNIPGLDLGKLGLG